MDSGNREIKSFADLNIYKNSYSYALIIAKELIPFLKKTGEFGTADQLSRSTKAIPALIAEGYAKRYEPKHLQKYINDAEGETNESIVHVSFTKDLGFPNPSLCEELIKNYTILAKQIYSFGRSWQSTKFNPSS